MRSSVSTLNFTVVSFVYQQHAEGRKTRQTE